MDPDARAWFCSRTTSARSGAELDVPALLRAKRRGGHRVSVVLPARNEAATVGVLVKDVRERWMGPVPLVDELLVVDSDSIDSTAAVARAAGADVVATTEVLPAHGTRPGEGEAGRHRHSSQHDESLGATAGQVVSAALTRAASRRPGQPAPAASGLLIQFRHDRRRFVPRSSVVAVDERPPMATVPEYRSSRAGIAG